MHSTVTLWTSSIVSGKMAISTGLEILVTIAEDSNINLKDEHFKGAEGLWEVLTRKKTNLNVVTTKDYGKYKSILQMTNTHLEQYEHGGNMFHGA
jgi:hypothetical protein